MRIALEPSPSRSQTPKDEVEWVPLPKNPLFTTTSHGGSCAVSRNLLAWDGGSRLYFWDSNSNCLDRLSLHLDDPDPTSVLAASPSKVLQADIVLDFDVHKISINKNGTAILLFGSERLCFLLLFQVYPKDACNLDT